jgi:hypothetical protein
MPSVGGPAGVSLFGSLSGRDAPEYSEAGAGLAASFDHFLNLEMLKAFSSCSKLKIIGIMTI